MPTFIDMSALTLKSSASGQEEIQVSESNKINTSQIAALAPSQQLTGFTALTAGKPAITANTTLLAAIQSLYTMVGSGKVKIVSDGADQTGMVCWNGTLASGFVINLDESAIYIRSQWTLASPDSVTDAGWIAAVKTGGTKTPFAAAAQNPNMGDLPTNSSLKFVDNKTTILGMLKMLTAAANVGRLRIVSGNPATGASGKPELAFIVNIVQGANAETQGTNGLQIFHLTNDYIRVIPSSSVAMAWPTLQTLTDEAIITKLHSTASGDWGGLGVTMEWAGSGGSAMKCLTVTDFKSNTFSNGAMGDIAVGEMFTFTSAVDAANGPGSALVGYAVKISVLSIKYVGTSTSINTYERSYLYTYQSTSIYATNWSILGTPTGIEASVYEFTYGDGANNVPTNDLKLVKVADIFRLVFSTPDQADYGQLDFIRSQDNGKIDQYVFVCPLVDTGATLGGSLQRIAVDATTGAVDMTGVSIAMVGQAAQKVMVTNFVAPTNAVIQNLSAGQGLIVYAFANATGLPSGVTGTAFYGHCIKNTLINSYTYLLQTADGSRTFSGSTNGTTTQWTELGGGSGGGMEALWTPTEATYVMVNSDAGNGDPVQINLTRALKATDRVLITWRKQNTSYLGIDVPGQAIINPNAYGHDVFLELVENFVTPSEYYGLFLDQSTTEAGSEALLFSAASWGGSTYGPQYLITGIYNISGK